MSITTSKILTKPPNTGFQERKTTKISEAQEQALRDQLHLEIEKKTKACSNASFDCTVARLEGYDFCIRHILQDPISPFKQCAYIYGNAKRCIQAAPRHDQKKDSGLTNYCFEHSRHQQLQKTRNSIGKFKEAETTENLLNNLTHHVKLDKPPKISVHEPEDDLDSYSVNPFGESLYCC